MSWLAKLASGASRFMAKAAPVAGFLARNAPSALNMASRGLNTAATLASNPLIQKLATSTGVSANAMRGLQGGISNIQAGLQLVPSVYNQVRQSAQAAAPAAKSVAELYRTLQGA